MENIFSGSDLDRAIKATLDFHIKKVEEELQCLAMSYTGAINSDVQSQFLRFVEGLRKADTSKETVSIILTTPGGVVEFAEEMVDILRHNFRYVYFIVPKEAMSAGTILCMSGDKIFMDYSSSLGPIDPQVLKQGRNGEYRYVPALGYLDQVNRMIDKSNKNELSPAEYVLLQDQDLAELARYEQAVELSTDLIQKWLVNYKFKDWNIHRSNALKSGQAVTEVEKSERAKEIAQILSNNQRWHSHGRRINMETLRTELRLEIDDYSDCEQLRDSLLLYNGVISDYMARTQIPLLLHSAHVT